MATNSGSAATSAAVTVTDTLPTGLTACDRGYRLDLHAIDAELHAQ